jgi:hypothetical protein
VVEIVHNSVYFFEVCILRAACLIPPACQTLDTTLGKKDAQQKQMKDTGTKTADKFSSSFLG